MHEDLRKVFDFLAEPGMCLGIIGSATVDYDRAKDIDVMLFGSEQEWRELIAKLGVKFNQWYSDDIDADRKVWLQRANLSIPAVRKNVQLLRNERYQWPTLFPRTVILQDGVVLHADRKAFMKQAEHADRGAI